jgi:lipid A disaccharide synthetase
MNKYEIVKQLIYIDKYGDMNIASNEDVIFTHINKKIAREFLTRIKGERVLRQYHKCKRKTHYTRYALVKMRNDDLTEIAVKLIEN